MLTATKIIVLTDVGASLIKEVEDLIIQQYPVSQMCCKSLANCQYNIDRSTIRLHRRMRRVLQHEMWAITQELFFARKNLLSARHKFAKYMFFKTHFLTTGVWPCRGFCPVLFKILAKMEFHLWCSHHRNIDGTQ